MQNIISLLFYLKKTKIFTGSAVPIYKRITVDGKRAEISTGRICASEKWNAQAGRSNGTKEKVKYLISFLDTIQSKLQETHRLMMAAGELISAETIKNKYTGKGEKPRSLVAIFEDHNNRVEALLGDEFAPGTLDRYKTSLKHTIAFMQWKFNIAVSILKESTTVLLQTSNFIYAVYVNAQTTLQ